MYRALADQCGLDAHAREDIVEKRRFPEGLNTAVPYFSLPRSGEHVKQVSGALVTQFGAETIARVPGFLVHCRSCEGLGSRADGPCHGCDGLGRIPPQFVSARGAQHDYALVGCDEDGLGFWGTVRRLPFDPEIESGKYRLLSSSRANDPSIAGLPRYHVAGRQFPAHEVWVTEGILKAEIAAAKLRRRVVGLYSTSVDDPTLTELCRLESLWSESCG